MTNYLIYINKLSEPVLVEVPEKPICNCDEIDGAGDFEEKHERCDSRLKEYEQALAAAIADESKHIGFIKKYRGLALKLIYGNPKELIDGLPVNYFEWIHNAKGKTYDIPSGYRIRIEEERWQDRCRKKFALLVQEPKVEEQLKEKQESITRLKTAQENSMRELKIYAFQAKHIEDTFRLVARTLESQNKETSMDRDVMQAWKMIENVLNGNINQHVSRL